MSNHFYDQFDEIFLAITKILNTYSSSEVLQGYFFKTFESFVYANLVNNFFLNLTPENLTDYSLSSDYIVRINDKYKKLRKDVNLVINVHFERASVNPASYAEFKQAIKKDFPQAFELISEIEKQFDIEELERYLNTKAGDIKKTGKSRKDFNSWLITLAMEAYVKDRGYFPFRDLDKALKAIPEALPTISETVAEGVRQNINKFLGERRQLFQALEERRYLRWQEPLDLFELLIAFSQEVGEKHKKKLDQSLLNTNKAKFAALVKIHVRACRTSNEILTLLKAGYPDGALARWRTLTKLAVVSFFLLDNDDTVSKRYLEHDTVLKCKQAREYQDYCVKLNYPPIDKKVLDNLKNE